MSARVPIAVLASGRGSNFEAIQSAIDSGFLAARITLVVSDRADAPVLEKAKAKGIPARYVAWPAAEAGESPASRRNRHESAVLAALADDLPRWIVLAGYMRVLGTELLGAFSDPVLGFSRVVNIHPALLPAFPGLESYRRAWEHGCAVAGATVHLVGEGIDDGPICAQEAFSIDGCRSAEEVEKLGLAVEHRLYPRTLSWLLSGRCAVESRRARFCVRQT
ncbi:MAG: phosphoribosylglycinamide formyltransferase [Bdellovibrionales bacterium]|nr:phosphoribosylglycinamide formyltransferase [Bdellovibrionales bacterium]